MVLFRTTRSSDLPVSRHMDTIAAGSVLRSHGLYPYLAINRLYTLILGQPPRSAPQGSIAYDNHRR